MHYRIIAVVDKGDMASPLRSGLPYHWLPCALRKPFPWEEVQKEVQPGDICIRQGRGGSDPTTTQAGDKGHPPVERDLGTTAQGLGIQMMLNWRARCTMCWF